MRNAPNLTPLAQCLAVTLALGLCARAGMATAMTPVPLAPTTRIVSSCADDGTIGTLRSQITIALPDDTIDMSTLSCSSISLQTGEIAITAPSVHIVGPSHPLVVSAGNSTRVFNHSGAGTLSISDLTIADGKYLGQDEAKGGCIATRGSLALSNVIVRDCTALALADHASVAGGAIYVRGSNLSLSGSTISGSVAKSIGSSFVVRGGGIAARDITAKYCTIRDNSAETDTGDSFGGGIHSYGRVRISASTIDSNRATVGAGVFSASLSATVPASLSIANSTVSGNVGSRHAGILAGSQVPLTLRSSTVAFNVADTGAGGVFAGDAATINNSIVAQNESGSSNRDLLVYNSSSALSGSANLIMSSNRAPFGTLRDNPRLAPLANRGGSTQTHALLANSPATNAGSDDLAVFDQRGSGFERVVGPRADIGAYERQERDDALFFDGFD